MVEAAWMSISGRAVYRLRLRGNGVLRQLTRQERGRGELPFSEILPRAGLSEMIGWIGEHCVPVDAATLAKEEGFGEAE